MQNITINMITNAATNDLDARTSHDISIASDCGEQTDTELLELISMFSLSHTESRLSRDASALRHIEAAGLPPPAKYARRAVKKASVHDTTCN
jgi:hypothetical protein